MFSKNGSFAKPVALATRRVAFVLLVSLATAAPTSASCVPPHSFGDIDALIYQTPEAALTSADDLLRTTVSNTTDSARLFAIKSEALGRMSRAADARKVAEEGLALAPDGSGVEADLLWLFATNGYTAVELQEARGKLNEALSQAAPLSAAAACLGIALGSVERLSGNFPEAARLLTDAYRNTDRLDLQVAHIEAARILARLMSEAEDTSTALDLNEVVLAYETFNNYSFMVGFAHGFRGIYLADARRFSEALEHLNIARKSAISSGDKYGEAYLNQHICRAQIGLNQWVAARESCQLSATFLASKNDSGRYGSEQLLAEIDLHDREPQTALERLNNVIAVAGPDSASALMEAYRLRADAHKLLGNASAALSDLESYLELYRDHATLIRDRQSQLLQARFRTDLKIAENKSLKQELELQSEYLTVWQERAVVVFSLLAVLIFTIYLWMRARFKYRQRLLEIAKLDDLTGLSNRRDSIDRIEALRLSRRRHDDALIVTLIDLDRFKQVNDQFGHLEGDRVLCAFSDCLVKTIGNTGVFGRWGGEEFICVFPDTNADEVMSRLDDLRVSFRSTAWAGSASRALDFSVGVASWYNTQTFQQVLDQADSALYQAKNTGRGKSALFASAVTAA